MLQASCYEFGVPSYESRVKSKESDVTSLHELRATSYELSYLVAKRGEQVGHLRREPVKRLEPDGL